VHSWAVSLAFTVLLASSAARFAPLACTHAIQLKTTPAMLATVPAMAKNQFQSLDVIQASFTRCL
jgi:hypothetical protein